ncbi:class I histocompatibility antigen, Non-RT1.A alpha-1 chain-like [Dendropsophus ebraccatus]|uniref:class I histocompatibility antigen, Non-RT1.A alpha-1 chain-like n=1 Tax=Dendropsophus ebraccatus TaxID=150705 RepID=UPI003830FE77
MNMFLLIVLILCLLGVRSDSHSLHYYYTVVSVPEPGLPDFFIVGYVDDQQTERYRSDNRSRLPVAEWMKKEKPEYWKMETLDNKRDEAFGREELKLVMNQFNHTEGFHIGQLAQGCELRGDGSTIGYQRFGYDGRDYMYLDVMTATYIPTMAEAQITTQRWNRLNGGWGKMSKNFLENKCVKKLKRFLGYGREDLERKVQPEVKVSHQESGEVTKLHCLVYGFHPRAVDVKWMKNEVDDVPTYQTTRTLPNPDGTYQIRVTAEVITKEGDSYSCYVDHSSLEEPILVRWDSEQKEDSYVTVILSAVVFVILVLTIIIAGVIVYISNTLPIQRVRCAVVGWKEFNRRAEREEVIGQKKVKILLVHRF